MFINIHIHHKHAYTSYTYIHIYIHHTHIYTYIIYMSYIIYIYHIQIYHIHIYHKITSEILCVHVLFTPSSLSLTRSAAGIFFGLSSILWTVAIADSIRRHWAARSATFARRYMVVS